MIFIDYHSRVPIYEQIKEQIIMAVNTGLLAPGDKLPSIRALSTQLNVNVNTIKRAMADLEHDGVIYSAQGRGIFVSRQAIGNTRIKEDALDDLKQSIFSAKAKGVTRDELERLISTIYQEGQQ
ncbi:MAG: GntR family transcriptional regulator [Eubacteriales bacterium]|nr:GntR family transcriptional regulator [Eubacteriales bacterium]